MLLLTGSDLDKVLEPHALMSALDLAFREVSSGKAQMPLRLVMPLPDGGRSLAMPAYLPASGALATKLITAIPDNLTRNLPLIQGVVVLSDPVTGTPLAVMDGRTITGLRTAVASAVAARVLARPKANTLALLGAGLQARSHLRTFAQVRDLQEVRIWSRTPESAERLRLEALEWHAGNVCVVAKAESAVRDAHIVVTVTAATEPIVLGDWLATGTHVCAVGAHAPNARELDTTVVTRSAVVAVDTREGCLAEAGDLIIPAAEGRLDVSRVAELGEILSGTVQGRSSDREITLYKSVGMAALDAAAAAVAYRTALECGIGLEVTL